MVVTTLSNSKAKEFIERLSHDYPSFKFLPGQQDHWSPDAKTITFKEDEPLDKMLCGVLHELAHAQLEHKSYQSDFELLKLESKAWELASKLGRKYGVKISDDHIQNCLDTYRDWLHRRSACPTCGMHVLQKDSGSYHCFNCQASWKVSEGKFVRSYRRKS